MGNSLPGSRAVVAAVMIGGTLVGALAGYWIANRDKSPPAAASVAADRPTNGTAAVGQLASETSGGLPGVTGAHNDQANQIQVANAAPGISGSADDPELLQTLGPAEARGRLPNISAIAPPESPSSVIFHPGVTGTVVFLPSGERSEGAEALPGVTDAKDQVVEKVKVPDVEKLTLKEARDALVAAGLKCLVPNKLAQDEDRVVRQSIHGGRIVDAGTEIRLDQVAAVVPDVVGMTVADAISRLNSEGGFDVRYGRTVTTENIVTRQQPKAGSYLPRGLTVTVACTVQVPNVLTLGVKDGADQIVAAGLEATYSVPADSSNFVFAQNPRAGSTVEVGTKVTLVPGVTAPNLLNMGYTEAEQTLVRMGVRGNVDGVVTQSVAVTSALATNREPWIIWQKPQGGAPMAKSDVLRVKVGRLQGVVVNVQPIGPAQPSAATCPKCGNTASKCICKRGG